MNSNSLLPELPYWLVSEIKSVYEGVISENERIVYIPYIEGWDKIEAIQELMNYKYRVQTFIK